MPKISQLPAAVNINNTDLLPIVQAGETKEIAFSDLLKGDAGTDLLWRNGNAPVSKSSNGYQKLPNGLIIQWGFETSSLNVQPITFPLAFPTAALFVAATKDPTGITTSVGFTYDTVVRNITNIGFEAIQRDSILVNFRWMAIGY